MAKKPEKTLAELGKQLSQQTRPSKDSIIKCLRQAASILLVLEQQSSLKTFIRPLSQALIKHGLLRHRDKDVRLLVAVCFCEILRVLAPDPSFDDKVFKDIFELFIAMFMELGDTTSPYFSRRVKILETVATLECCRRMLDLGCDDLILKMFDTFFTVVRKEHHQGLINGMVSVMSLILNEEEETSQPLMEVVLQNLINKGEGPVPASCQLAVSLIQNCAERIKPAICRFLMSCISDRESVMSDLKERYHEVLIEVFQCTPNMLHSVIRNLTEELMADQVDVRLKAVGLIGKLLALPGDHDVHEHQYLFVELLKRFSDKSADVRIHVIRAVKACYLAKPFGTESHKILSCLEGRLLDLDASVRTEAVATVCSLGKLNLKNFPEVLIARVTDRLRDKMISVRKVALRMLLEIYREYCTKCYEGQMMLTECFEQIPCKILMLSWDKSLKEFRPQNLELLLARDLFPVSLPGEDRMKHWIYVYSLFTPAHVKALNLILCQKRRFQTEMHSYLSLRIKDKGTDPEEVNTKIKNAFTRMSAFFVNPVKAEESFFKLNELKDNSILFQLSQLLAEPVLSNAKVMRDNFLEDIGDKHSLFEFLELLSLKCSNNIFSSEHVQHLLDHVSGSRGRDNFVEESSFSLLTDIVRNFPLLLRDSEHQFKMLMLEDETALSGKLLQIIAKVGPSISMELSEIFPVLERLCLEGTRAESKAAISVITASLGCSNQSLLMDLCQRLVESLHCGQNIPTVLQSLGCILQQSVLAFEQYENEVSSYITERIFEDEMTEDDIVIDQKSGCSMSSSCKLKVYGLKTLVKIVSSKKETNEGAQISILMDILSEAIVMDKFPETASACEGDTAHMRLAAAKSVLRLSRRWDMHISPQMFRSTVMMAKEASFFVRKAFLDKAHKLLKNQLASSKFACAFALAASDCIKDQQDASIKYMADFIKAYGRAARTCPISGNEGSMTSRPEYIVVFLLHVLAHDAEYPSMDSHNEEHFALFCRPLLLVLHLLLNSQLVDGNLDLVNKTILNLRSIFRAIKRAEDAVDPEKTFKLHLLADIGTFSVNVLQQDSIDLSLNIGLVLLPSSLYKTSAARKTNEGCETGFVNEDFVRKLVDIFECDFSQLFKSNVKHGQSCLKDGVKGQSIVNLSVSKQAELLRNARSQKKVIKEMTKTHVLEACPKAKQQKTLSGSSVEGVPLQDGSSVIEELEADGSGNLEHLQAKEHYIASKSRTLELFGTESDVSTQELDFSLSVSQEDERKRKIRCESAENPELSQAKLRHGFSSDGSTVSCLQDRDAIKKCAGDGSDEILTVSGEGTTSMRGRGNSKRKILVDKTNLLAVNGLLKQCQPKQTSQGQKSCTDTSASEISDENVDAIAFRTRRRRT